MMTATTDTVFNPKAKKFVLLLLMIGLIMVFMGLTSGYIVRKAEGNWLNFQLPSAFQWSSVIIIISSLTMYLSHRALRTFNYKRQQLFLAITGLLGVAFLASQWSAWVYLVDSEIFFTGNPAGSFLYVISGLHGVHIIAGLIFIAVLLFGSIRKINPTMLKFRSEMGQMFWHFIGALWLYLYIFLILNH
ncbi:MAG: cytochrome c oxidase subunit 3 [Sphingobacteriales bacterium]|jgi:cytochrome c oxidase subunit 3